MRWPLLSLVGGLYAGQFIPAIFIFMTLPIILRDAGHSATHIGLVQLVGLPYVVKFLWAPLIDSYRITKQHYKGWIFSLSIVHVGALIGLSFVDPGESLVALFVLLFVAVTAVSTQDVALDALVICLTTEQERIVVASLQSFGLYLSAVVGAFGFFSVYLAWGWQAAILLQAGVFALPVVLLTWRVEHDAQQPLARISWHQISGFFKQPDITNWLGLLATVRLPLVLISLALRLLMVESGIGQQEIAFWFGLIAMSSAGLTALILGPLLGKLSQRQALSWVVTLNTLVLILVIGLTSTMPETARFMLVAIWMAIALTDTLLLRGAMARVRHASPGADFSLQVALFTLLAMLASPVAGWLIDAHGYHALFAGALLLGLFPVLILWFGNKKEAI